ncbi:putative glutathione transferase [Helianthus annuus]|nr:putative glutathione transferase [Helianthus annuus]
MKSYCSPLIFNHPPISSTPAHIISSPAYLIFSRPHSFPFHRAFVEKNYNELKKANHQAERNPSFFSLFSHSFEYGFTRPSVKKSTRGVNFIPEEDKLLVSAWLNHSLDAIQGTDQKYSQLWEKIFEYFQQHKETTIERTIKSLSNRWSCIQKATNSFCSCLAQVERLNQSGMTEQDKFDKAKIMYQSEEKCNFLFEHCWNLLKEFFGQPGVKSAEVEVINNEVAADDGRPSSPPDSEEEF